MARPSFTSVERNYTLTIVSDYWNTCAIRMSKALAKADVASKDAFRAAGVTKTSTGSIRGAQDLAAILRRVWGAPDQSWAGTVGKPIGDGVICYMNIPSYPDGQGHIGLWKDGKAYANDEYWSANPIWFWRLN